VYAPHGNNFVRTMLRLGETQEKVRVVADQYGQPTSAHDIAAVALAVARALVDAPGRGDLAGIFHAAGNGATTWADFAEAIFAGAVRRGRRPVIVERITSDQYPTPARRPHNSRLDCSKLARVHGLTLPDWRSSLATVLDRLLTV
jgi:dTDP-4-dehydrorhamnose reductase